MAYGTLVDVATLAEGISRPDWRVFDCRCSPVDPDLGRQSYQSGHLPGARHADLDRVLASTPTRESGRHPLPGREALSKWLSDEGVSSETQVVVYDDVGGAFAARLWWLLRWLGHSSVAVLDGGLQAWQRSGGESEQGDAATPAKARFEARRALGEPVETGEVLDLVQGLRSGYLIDARSAERYRGESEPIDPVAGHIPGAHSHPFRENLSADGCFRTQEELRQRFGSFAEEPHKVVHYCGSGVTACHNVLAMEIAGLTGSKLYAGSWSEWIRSSRRPVERGE